MPVTRGVLYELSSGGVLTEASTGRLLYDVSGLYEITRDHYFSRNQPAKSEEIKNRVVVKYSPLIEGEPAEVYRSSEPVSLGAGASVTIEAEHSGAPCIDALAALDNVSGSTFSITSQVHYSWGSLVTISNTGLAAGSCDLYIDATPLVVEGEDSVTSESAPSIVENGVLEYKFPENHLLQTLASAELIGPALLASYALPRKDVSIQWMGDPSLELGDEIRVPVYVRNTTIVTGNFYIFKMKLDFDGTLRATTDGRKIA